MESGSGNQTVETATFWGDTDLGRSEINRGGYFFLDSSGEITAIYPCYYVWGLRQKIRSRSRFW